MEVPRKRISHPLLTGQDKDIEFAASKVVAVKL
jgi:hypothetical protein